MTVAEQLQKTDLFHEVELKDLEALVNRMKEESVGVGVILFQAGDPGDTMYIIQSGRIRIFMHDNRGNEITLTHYGEHEIFGELSPIDQRPRSASAAAAEPLKLLSLNRDDFLSFLDERPQIGIAMMRSLSQRLRNTTTYLEEFKPTQFETAAEEEKRREELSRKAATPTLARILDDVDRERASQPSIEVPKDIDLKESQRLSMFDSVQKKEEEQNTPAQGIFDRIAKAQDDKKQDKDEPE